MSRMSNDQENRRQSVEDTLSHFGAIHKAMRSIQVHTKFLRERFGEKTNTAAIVEELELIRNHLSQIEGSIEDVWKIGQDIGWTVKE